MNNERDSIILRLKNLYAIHEAKQEEYQKKYNTGPEVGFATREACLITKLYPTMLRLNITFDDI